MRTASHLEWVRFHHAPIAPKKGPLTMARAKNILPAPTVSLRSSVHACGPSWSTKLLVT